MRTLVDDRLLDEATRFSFRFACEDCAHASQTNGIHCSLGYPPSPLRKALRQDHLELCKTFELG